MLSLKKALVEQTRINNNFGADASFSFHQEAHAFSSAVTPTRSYLSYDLKTLTLYKLANLNYEVK